MSALLFFKLPIFALLPILATSSSSSDDGFTFNGFAGANFSLDGAAQITSSGLLVLTNTTGRKTGHAFLSTPMHFQNPVRGANNNSTILSFSTTFAFAIAPEFPESSAHGMAFVISPTQKLAGGSSPGIYMGVFDGRNNGNSSNHILAVELDTTLNAELKDINDNHVGIDVNSITSVNSSSAGYYSSSDGRKENLTLASGDPMLVWVEYDGEKFQLNVTLSPLRMAKPALPLLSTNVNLSQVLLNNMYVGFSAATGKAVTAHYVLGWSFQMNGKARELDISALPSVPRSRSRRERTNPMTIWLPIVLSVFLVMVFASIAFGVAWKIKFAELLEDWEEQYGPHRFSYRDLYRATRGFKDSSLIGVGGFGKVYRGVLPDSKLEIAVKKVSHGSRQGIKEFVAEIVSIGRLRHRNLVQLLGYCRRKGELLLVYDFMHNGSLDKFLHDQMRPALNWNRRFHIIKGVASGLLYLHEGWEQVVIHRDIKASNVLLDGEFNGRLGDFGLARLYDHGTGPQTTHLVGTMGYIAPELTRTGKPSKASDVFAFGAFLLEVVCGKRPIDPREPGNDVVLVDWVLENWKTGAILEAVDQRLRGEFVEEEMELVLMLGLRCSHHSPDERPSMRQVMQLLDGDVPLPELSSSSFDRFKGMFRLPQLGVMQRNKQGLGDSSSTSDPSSSTADWILSGGR